jgi:MYXO-CTERM domain-containing protein
MVMDPDGVNTVEIYFATATSSAGQAEGIYQPATMTSTTNSTYTYMDQVQNLAGGFPEPESFHSLYVRFFLLVEDNNNDVTTDPLDATEIAANENYLPTYVQNVVPTGTASIAEVRQPVAEDVPRWEGHSVRVQGVALVENGVLDPDRTLFTIQDDSGAAIPYFSTSSVAPDFAVGDRLIITGVVGTFLDSTQLEDGDIEVTDTTGPVPETTLTLAQILAEGDQYEAELVKVDDVDFVDPRTTWPSDPGDLGSWNVPIRDMDGNQIVVRVTTGATGVFGQAAPQYGFDIRGVLNERNGVWQLFPRNADDISAHPMPPLPDGGMGGMDATPGTDTGVRPDAGTGPGTDSGTGTNPDEEGCDCSAARHGSSSGAFGLILLALGAFIRRRK